MTEDLKFKSDGILTLGVEIEIQLIDKNTLDLTSRADEVLELGKNIGSLKPESYKNTVEIITDKCVDAHQVEKDLKHSIDSIIPIGEKLGIGFATTGSHPFSHYADNEATSSPRYDRHAQIHQIMSKRLMIYGMHIHIGMENEQDCIRFNNFFMPFLSHFLALSASSPFWLGYDSGLASFRPTTYESVPTCGHPYEVESWSEFESLYNTLIKCRAIKSLKDLWWDIRPSPRFGTLELRIFDVPPTISEAVAITAYVHLLSHWFKDNCNWLTQLQPQPRFMLRENKWRAIRYGLDAEIILNADGKTSTIREEINSWLDITKDYAKKLGYETYVETIRTILQKGTSSDRQRAVFEKTDSIKDVVAHNVAEFLHQKPIW